jgi:hypothetical protein
MLKIMVQQLVLSSVMPALFGTAVLCVIHSALYLGTFVLPLKFGMVVHCSCQVKMDLFIVLKHHTLQVYTGFVF